MYPRSSDTAAEATFTTLTEANDMRERDQIAKNESGKKASKSPQGKSGLNGILETVRQKMAYTLRGI
jgi:hypothetical protein